MLVIGIVCFLIFPLWESKGVLAPRPLIPLHLLKSGNFSAGCAVGFFYFSTSLSYNSRPHLLTKNSGLLPLRPTILLDIVSCTGVFRGSALQGGGGSETPKLKELKPSFQRYRGSISAVLGPLGPRITIYI
jgi:hypothetical protein